MRCARPSAGEFFARARVLLLILLLTACVPVAHPPQLSSTPGAAFVVTADTLDFGIFRVEYPAGWRVISGAASLPPTVIFAAPENAALLLLSVVPIDRPPALDSGAPMRSEARTLNFDGTPLYVYSTAPVAEWAIYGAIFERLLTSITVP
ncbi:MAG: hypothetical protein HXY40_12505 [Chloroflexi bacterium]|nr:hypothetical protein [Chloroflexota bacterium]